MILSPAPIIVLAILVFFIGALGVVLRRNAIVVFMCIELMLGAANMVFVAASGMHNNIEAQVSVLVVMAVAAAEAAVGLAIVLAVFRSRKSVDTADSSVMAG